MSNFAKKLKSELENNNLSIHTLSKIIRISSSQLSKYASGKYEPSLKNALIICNYFGCSMDYFCNNDANKNSFGVFNKENVELFYRRFNCMLKRNNTNINRVAKHTLINRNCIYHWQNKSLFPKVSILAKLASELNTNIEYLIGRTDIMERCYAI